MIKIPGKKQTGMYLHKSIGSTIGTMTTMGFLEGFEDEQVGPSLRSSERLYHIQGTMQEKAWRLLCKEQANRLTKVGTVVKQKGVKLNKRR